METPFVLQASLEKNYRRDTRYDLALRAILLRATAHSRQRGLGKWIHDTRRLNRSDPGYYQGVTASRPSPLFRQLPGCRSLGRPCVSRTSLHRYLVMGEWGLTGMRSRSPAAQPSFSTFAA